MDIEVFVIFSSVISLVNSTIFPFSSKFSHLFVIMVRHFLRFIPVEGSLVVRYVFSEGGGGMGKVERGDFGVFDFFTVNFYFLRM